MSASAYLVQDTAARCQAAASTFEEISRDNSSLPNDLRKLTAALLADLDAHSAVRRAWDQTVTAQAVGLLKIYSRDVHVSSPFNSDASIKTLLELSSVISTAGNHPYLKNRNRNSVVLPPYALDALRCLANTLFLHESARQKLASIEGILPQLVSAGSSESPLDLQFLAERLIFLLTVNGDNIRELAEDNGYLQILGDRISSHTQDLQLPESHLRVQLLNDRLKTAFNFATFYERMISKQASSSPKPPTSPDLSTSPPSETGSPRLGKRAAIKNMFSKRKTVKPMSEVGFAELIGPIVNIILHCPLSAPPAPFGTLRLAICPLLNLPITPPFTNDLFAPLASADIPATPSLPSTSPTHSSPTLPPLYAKLLYILDRTLQHWLPNNPDEDEDYEKLRSAKEPLDEGLRYLLILLHRLVGEATSPESENARSQVKQLLLAPDIDRTRGLEHRKDLTGYLIRLMKSSFFQHSSFEAGFFLFALCQQDGSEMSAQIGFGNASGFLSNVNLLSAGTAQKPKQSESTDERPINPITGAYDIPTEDPTADMTEEEKLAEAERLYELFERMNKNPSMSMANPVAEAVKTGKMEEIDKKVEEQAQREEDLEEEAALKELAAYKKRRAQI